jgi:hypothetical protein
MVSPNDAVPPPLVFGSLSEARSYAERDQPGAVRIIWVTEESKRLVVETFDREGAAGVPSANAPLAQP